MVALRVHDCVSGVAISQLWVVYVVLFSSCATHWLPFTPVMALAFSRISSLYFIMSES